MWSYINILTKKKSKFIVTSRSVDNQSNLPLDDCTFEKVNNFKYLEVNINSKNDMHQEMAKQNSKLE